MHPVKVVKKGTGSLSRNVPQICGALAVQVAVCNLGTSGIILMEGACS
jgi:hypothetical protein